MLAGRTIEQVSASIAGSEEFFVTQGGSTNDVVVQAYQYLLARAPSTFEAINWQTVLNFGGTDQSVYSGIAGSQEYFEKAQT